MQTLALVHSNAKEWSETQIEGGTTSSTPTASGVVKDLAFIASVSVQHRAEKSYVAFGFAVAGSCLLAFGFMVGLCRLYRCLCFPRYSGELAEVQPHHSLSATLLAWLAK